MTKCQKIGMVIFAAFFLVAWGLAGRADEQSYRELHPVPERNDAQMLLGSDRM